MCWLCHVQDKKWYNLFIWDINTLVTHCVTRVSTQLQACVKCFNFWNLCRTLDSKLYSEIHYIVFLFDFLPSIYSNALHHLPPPQALRFQSQSRSRRARSTRNWERAREGSWEGERSEARRLLPFPLLLVLCAHSCSSKKRETSGNEAASP